MSSSTSTTNRNHTDPVPGIWSGAYALAGRELTRFFRQRTRIVGAIGQPIIFWFLFGAGLRSSFQAPPWASQLDKPLSYQEYFFPGIAVLIVMFTAIFSTISIIEDRREGFLQGVLAAPVPRSTIVIGKVGGGVLLSVIQAGLFLIIGPLLSVTGLGPDLQISVTPSAALTSIAFLLLIAVELTALGFLIAWPMSSTQGFHAIMSVFLMPMWLLSGAFFPGEGAGWLSWIIQANPLTYGVAGLRRLMYSGSLPVTESLPSLSTSVAVTTAFAAILFVVCVAMVARPTTHNVT